MYFVLVRSKNILTVQILLTLTSLGIPLPEKTGQNHLQLPTTPRHVLFSCRLDGARRCNWQPSRWRIFSRMLRTSMAGNEALGGKWKTDKISLRR
jgi:hypothetical protein